MIVLYMHHSPGPLKIETQFLYLSPAPASGIIDNSFIWLYNFKIGSKSTIFLHIS